MSATPRVGASCSNQATLGSMSGIWRRMKEDGLKPGMPEGAANAALAGSKPAHICTVGVVAMGRQACALVHCLFASRHRVVPARAFDPSATSVSGRQCLRRGMQWHTCICHLTPQQWPSTAERGFQPLPSTSAMLGGVLQVSHTPQLFPLPSSPWTGLTCSSSIRSEALQA